MLQIVFDSHFEGMYRPAENYEFENSKGYFEMRIHPRLDYFYLLQLVNSQKGFIDRKERDFAYCDAKTDKVIDPDDLNLDDEARLRFVFRKKKTEIKRNRLRIGIHT